MRTLFGMTLMVFSAACAGAPPPPESESDNGDGAAAACPESEISFSREEGCLNDGSVELCLPADADEALARARIIAPEITCTQGSRGRAQCDPHTQRLCLVPLASADCVAPHGALTEHAWLRVCALAAMPEVEQVVPTFYE
jgi:hypothetical protein